MSPNRRDREPTVKYTNRLTSATVAGMSDSIIRQVERTPSVRFFLSPPERIFCNSRVEPSNKRHHSFSTPNILCRRRGRSGASHSRAQIPRPNIEKSFGKFEVLAAQVRGWKIPPIPRHNVVRNPSNGRQTCIRPAVHHPKRAM